VSRSKFKKKIKKESRAAKFKGLSSGGLNNYDCNSVLSYIIEFQYKQLTR